MLKLDSLYIHRRGFTSTTTNSNQPSQLPPKACAEQPRTNTLGNPTMPVPCTPLLRGLSPRLPGAVAYAGQSGLLYRKLSRQGMTQTTPRGGRSPRPCGSRGLGAGPAQPRIPAVQDATVGQHLALGALPDGSLPGRGTYPLAPIHAAAPHPPREDSGHEL